MFRAYVVSCGRGVAIGCVGGRNKILACCNLISFGEALNLISNFCGDEICWRLDFGYG